MTTESDLTMFRGDDRVYTMTVTVDDVVFDLTGCSVKFTAKRHMADQDSDAIIALSTATGGVVLTTPASGILTVTIPANATASLVEDTALYWDLQITDTGGRKRTIPEPTPGKLMVRSDVTRV